MNRLQPGRYKESQVDWRPLKRLFGLGGTAPDASEKRSTVLRPLERPERQSAASGDDDFEAGAAFSATAGDQLRDSRQSVLDRARVKLRAFLTPSQPVTSPKAFAGRSKLMKRVIGAIEDERLHIVLYGSRGMGKTSLLHVLTQLAREARYIVLYGSCSSETGFTDMFRGLLADIPMRYHGGHRAEAGAPAAGGNFAGLLPEGKLTAREVTDLLCKISGTRVLIILDEFDRAHSPDFRRTVADLIKGLSDRSARAQLVIGGVGSNVNELIEHIPSIQRNIIGVQVPPMAGTEVRQLLKMTQEQVGVGFDEGAADLVVELAGGWPYVASLLAHHASLIALGEGRMEVSRDDVELAIVRGRDDVTSRLSPESLKETHFAGQREGYGCLDLAARTHIACGGEFTGEDLRALEATNHLRRGCAESVERLAADGLLFELKEDRFGKTYAFRDSTVPLFLWLARSAPHLDEPRLSASE